MNYTPCSLNTERAVIASIITESSVDFIKNLEPDDFYDGKCRAVFETAKELHKQGAHIEPTVLADALQIPQAGTVIGELMGGLPVNNPAQAINDLREASIKRRALVRLDNLFNDLNQSPEKSSLLVSRAVGDIKEIENTNPLPGRLTLANVTDFLGLELPPRENILDPWLPSQGLCMIYAPRGIGKTFVSVGIATAVATGSTFLGWKAEKPRGVLFIDGEMPAVALQERFRGSLDQSDIKAPLMIITPDLQTHGMPDLSSHEGQREIEPFIKDDIDLIILDNISTLVRTGRENDAEGWLPVQQWALQMRAGGKSVLFIHHAGKGGQQRGSSKKEDVLDTVISLKRPSGYSPIDGACFEIHFDKHRGLAGESVRPFEAKLESTEGAYLWTTRSLDESTCSKVLELSREGLSQKEIADELGIHKSTVSRHLKKAELHVATP